MERQFLPTAVFIARLLLYLDTVIWLALGVTSLLRIEPGNSVGVITLWVIAILMFGNAGALLIAGLWLGRLSKWAWLFALAVLFVNILLTVTDEFGALDLITLVIDLAIVALLVGARKTFWQVQPKP